MNFYLSVTLTRSRQYARIHYFVNIYYSKTKLTEGRCVEGMNRCVAKNRGFYILSYLLPQNAAVFNNGKTVVRRVTMTIFPQSRFSECPQLLRSEITLGAQHTE